MEGLKCRSGVQPPPRNSRKLGPDLADGDAFFAISDPIAQDDKAEDESRVLIAGLVNSSWNHRSYGP
jgi:hypothetical protein